MPPKRHSLLQALVRLHFITPRGVVAWSRAFVREGVTLMTLFRYAALVYPHRTALIFEGREYTYRELYHEAKSLAHLLQARYGYQRGMRVALLCRNHLELVLLLPALSRLGIGAYLLNSDMSSQQVAQLLCGPQCRYHALIIDDELTQRCLPTQPLACPHLTTETLRLERTRYTPPRLKLPRIWRGAELSVLTGGSSGNYKEAARRPSATAFLPPLVALIRSIGIHLGNTTYVALPLYHGFGLSTLLISFVMGKRVWLTRRFHTHEALAGISRYGVDVLPIVPVMLARMLESPDAPLLMRSLRCIISGGDRLSRSLVAQVHSHVAPLIYNLYGTSEAGFFLLATPHDLDSTPHETSLGRPIAGVRCELRDLSPDGVGTLWVRSRWAMQSRRNAWQSTGDRMYRDPQGLYYHRGRADRMVVCGGENVYPENVERALEQHPDVVAVQVYPTPHPQWGHVLSAQVELTPDSPLTSEALTEWLRPHVSRPELPHRILFGPLSITATGKRKL